MLIAGRNQIFHYGGPSARQQSEHQIDDRLNSINKSSESVITISSTSSSSMSNSSKYNLIYNLKESAIHDHTTNNISSTFLKSPCLLYPTKTHRISFPSRSESTDSLKSEIREFKPIRVAPTTPKIPGRKPGGKECKGSDYTVNFCAKISNRLPGESSAFSFVYKATTTGSNNSFVTLSSEISNSVEKKTLSFSPKLVHSKTTVIDKLLVQEGRYTNKIVTRSKSHCNKIERDISEIQNKSKNKQKKKYKQKYSTFSRSARYDLRKNIRNLKNNKSETNSIKKQRGKKSEERIKKIEIDKVNIAKLRRSARNSR
ncbi:uncharacterized protein LOC134836534 isoform X2 [Culicoides brevitarsis]|uniref:uncharacterized protein LOC134836534 isoform X2 n=1 Tax=Culicoides brevitarsis TaxID=469753 RepID=UPI00307C6B09